MLSLVLLGDALDSPDGLVEVRETLPSFWSSSWAAREALRMPVSSSPLFAAKNSPRSWVKAFRFFRMPDRLCWASSSVISRIDWLTSLSSSPIDAARPPIWSKPMAGAGLDGLSRL